MDVKYINPFIEGSKKILKELLGNEPTAEAPKLLDTTISGGEIAVIIGLVGEIRGQVMFTMDEETAINIAKKMTYDDTLSVLDDFAESAITEMSNMISGSTCMAAYAVGVNIDITPPSMCRGTGLVVTSKNKFISIPLDLVDVGKFFINISFEKVQK